MIVAYIEETVAFQPERLMDLEVQTNRSHAVYYMDVVISEWINTLLLPLLQHVPI